MEDQNAFACTRISSESGLEDAILGQINDALHILERAGISETVSFCEYDGRKNASRYMIKQLCGLLGNANSPVPNLPRKWAHSSDPIMDEKMQVIPEAYAVALVIIEEEKKQEVSPERRILPRMILESNDYLAIFHWKAGEDSCDDKVQYDEPSERIKTSGVQLVESVFVALEISRRFNVFEQRLHIRCRNSFEKRRLKVTGGLC